MMKGLSIRESFRLIDLSKYLCNITYTGVCNYASWKNKDINAGTHTFYVKDKKLGLKDDKMEAYSDKELAFEGLRIIQKGIPLLKEEIKEHMRFDVRFSSEHGNFEYLFQADDKENMKSWITSTDADYHHGKSSAKFSVSQSNKTVFHGVMRPDVPKDGKTRKLGYCNLRSPYKKKSFERQFPYDWSTYTHLLLRVRGDGRNYFINIHPDRYYDVHWMDLYQYPLFTRGGPYWQFVKIPFSSFFLSAVGRIQDKQEKLELQKVKCLSITAQDYYGSFYLEIDYIALIYDENDDNLHLYELYEKHPYITE